MSRRAEPRLFFVTKRTHESGSEQPPKYGSGYREPPMRFGVKSPGKKLCRSVVYSRNIVLLGPWRERGVPGICAIMLMCRLDDG